MGGCPTRTFIVDYSHNGLFADQRSADTARLQSAPPDLRVSAGRRGRTQVRRRELAEASGRYADYTIITSDNPDNEPPEDVIRDIASYMPPGRPYTCITDRREV